MPTATKTGICPVCSLEVDLVRGKLKDHPPKTPRGSRKGAAPAVCPGSGEKPKAVAPAGDGDASPVANGDAAPVPEPVVLAPTLDLMLLEGARPDGAWAGAQAATLDPALCDPDPNNPRKDLGDLGDLALSLVAEGMLEPIIVAPGPTEGRYTIVAGHRRVAAALQANLTEVPALIRADLTPGSNLSLIAQVVENLHRLPLTPIEEAHAYDLLRQLGMKQTDIATAASVNQGQVSKRLALLKLPEDLAGRVGIEGPGALDVADAVEITRLPAAARKAAVEQITAGAGDPAAVIRRARAAAEKDAEHQAIVDKLEADRVALVDFPASWHWGRDREDRPLATGPDGERQPYGGARTLDIPFAEHNTEPCHGAAVSARDEVIYVCLDPTRHGYPSLEDEAAADEAARAADAEAREAEQAARAAALAARKDAARRAALADVKRPYMVDVIAEWTIQGLRLAGTDWYVGDDLDLLGVLADWSGVPFSAEEAVDDVDEIVATLTAQHGALRLAYMVAVAGAEALLDLPTYYRSVMADSPSGAPFLAGHFDRLAETAGYEITDADRALMQPPQQAGPVLPPGGPDCPQGALAWYDPDAEALLEGDEPRWITDPAELEAISVDHADRVVLVDVVSPGDVIDPAVSSDAERTKAENGDASPGPDADVALADSEAPPVGDPGDDPVPGERCPASRKAYMLGSNVEGVPCPARCGSLVSTTAAGRVRDHDVPEPVGS